MFIIFIRETGSGYEIYVKKCSGTNIESSKITISKILYMFSFNFFICRYIKYLVHVPGILLAMARRPAQTPAQAQPNCTAVHYTPLWGLLWS